MPETFAEFRREWEFKEPDWEFIDWTSMDELEDVVGPLPKFVYDAERYYPSDWKRFQADVLRLQILQQLGGVYVDTDVQPGFEGLDSLISRHPLRSVIVGRSPQHMNGHHPITNCVMVAAPGNPFIRECARTQKAAADFYHHLALARSVGPWHLTRIYEGGNWPDVAVLGPSLFKGRYFLHHWNTGKRKRGEGLG